MLDDANYTPRLKALYRGEIRAAMTEQFSYSNVMMVPRLDKIVINMGVGEAVKDTKKVRTAADGVKGTAFDGRGNYAMGLKEHLVFPEIEFDKVDDILGMDIIICTTAKSDAEAKALLKLFNMPFAN